jgi:Tol biopolymer transport system component
MRFALPSRALAAACVAAVQPVVPELFGKAVISTPDYELNAAPEVAPFSGVFSDADLAVAPDGTRLVFISRSRAAPDNPGRPVPHIWYVDRTTSGWTEPRNAGTLNSEGGGSYPSVAADGTLYFESARAGGRGPAGVYRSWLRNGEAPEFCPSLSPDGRYLYFRSTRH